MLNQVSEKKMHWVRMIIAIGWLTLIASLFYDPISHIFTEPENTWSFLHLPYEGIDPEKCREYVTVQGKCVEEHPYALGAKIFWGMILPIGVMILLLFGHEFWRRICPLSFLSQIPRALGIQRQRKEVNPRTGSVRYELVKIKPDSWLGRNHLYFQFIFLCVGLALRILFINSHRLLLGSWFVLTVLAAIAVGYLYAGKSWCQYFCPMGPVQLAYNGPRALLGSEAYKDKIPTQSMCRTVIEGQEKSACVTCQSPCFDIDAERNYWEILHKPGRKFAQYGYVGLVVGFYLYYLLYSGTLKYYYSGAWNHEEDQLAKLFSPGFYIFNQPIPIPKLIAAPLTIAVFVIGSYFLFCRLEKAYKAYRLRNGKPVSQERVQHIFFSLATFASFNTYFMFGGRPVLKLLLPPRLELGFNAFVIFISGIWLYRTLGRTSESYTREGLTNSLRRQLGKLPIDFPQFLSGRSLDELEPNEVYVLAKVLPNFNKAQGLKVYQGLLKEALAEGNVTSANSLEVLRQIRIGLVISDEEHFNVLTELGIENPDLIDPNAQKSRENLLRIESYREALELQLLESIESGLPLQEALEKQKKQLKALKLEYGISNEEEEKILEQMYSRDSAILRTAENLLTQLRDLTIREQILANLPFKSEQPALKLLRVVAITNKQRIFTQKLLSVLEILGDNSAAIQIAQTTSLLASKVLPHLLTNPEHEISWQQRLDEQIWSLLYKGVSEEAQEPTGLIVNSEPEVDTDLENKNLQDALVQLLQEFLSNYDPLIRAASLYALNQIEPQQGETSAKQLINNLTGEDWLVKEVADDILATSKPTTEELLPTLLVRINHHGDVQEQVFQQSVISIGSSSINDIVLVAPLISPQHAFLYLDQEGVNVIDLGTPQGLTVRDQIIKDARQRLHQGDTIFFSSGKQPSPSLVVHWDKETPESTEFSLQMSTLDKMLLLFESDFFSSLNPEALIEIARTSSIRMYPQGTTICQEGTVSDEIFLLLDGAADVMIADKAQVAETHAIKVGEVKVNETIGEMGVLNKEERSASVITTAPTNQLLVIKAKDFENILRNNQELSRNVIMILSHRLRNLSAQMKVQ
jgi:CRP-like cAMP-binding protein